MDTDRNWTVLFIGGASGIGKSSLAYEVAQIYGVNVIEVDDICRAVETVTTKDNFPAIHYWDGEVNWKDVGVEGNVNWLIDVSKELTPALKALVDRHIEDNVPIIIEGDFINPEFTKSFNNPRVKSIFIQESNKDQILRNYQSREGGELQHYRAEIGIAYGSWIADICNQKGIPLVESRPWKTALTRAIECLI